MRRIIFAFVVLFTLSTLSYTQERLGKEYIVTLIAYDRFAPVVTNPREPHEVLIAEKGGSDLRPGPVEIVRIVYFPDTTGRRGGTNALPPSTLQKARQWVIKGRAATKAELGALCTSDNYFRAADSSIDTNENGEPMMRFESLTFRGYIVFSDLVNTGCLIADSVPTPSPIR
jgi:hypothetical protein